MDTRLTSFELLPPEMWLEIIKYLDKEALRQLLSTCRELYEFPGSYELFLKATWPQAEFSHGKIVRNSFFWPVRNTAYDVPQIFILDNADILIAMRDGRLYLQRLGDLHWMLIGMHSAGPVTSAILMRFGDLVTCGRDGIKIWDRRNATLKAIIKIPKDIRSRAISLLELNVDELVVGCVHSVHFVKISSSSLAYDFGDSIRLDAKTKLIQLLKKNNEIIAYCDNTLLRINHKTHKIIDQLSLFLLKNKLFDGLVKVFGSEEVVNDIYLIFREKLSIPYHFRLEFKWNYPLGYAGVIVNDRHVFLVNLYDINIHPLFIGINNHIHISVTKNNDILACTETGFYRYGWNSVTNQFEHYESIANEIDLIGLKNDEIMIYNKLKQSISFFNPVTKIKRDIQLKIPGGIFIKIFIEILQDDYILAYCSTDEYFILDAENGDVMLRFPCKDDELISTINGDLIEKTRIPINDKSSIDEINIRRFNTRKPL